MDLIYHYCDANPLMSMVRDGTIWLSSLRAMNDTGELDYFRKVAIPATLDALKRFNRINEDGLLFAARIAQTEYYAVCFSTLADDLYQWQVYGQQGKGFAIGFDPETLCPDKPGLFEVQGIGQFQAPMSTGGLHTMGISPVTYVSPQEIDRYAAVVAEMLKPDVHGGQVSIDQVVSIINVLSAVVKSDGFKAENERRLLYGPTIRHPQGNESYATIEGPLKDRKWRNGKYGLTPYFEYGNVNKKPSGNGEVIVEPNYSVKSAIRRIVLGPNCPEQPDGLLQDFLYSHGLTAVEVVRSKATFR